MWQGRRVAECAIDRHELVQQAVTLLKPSGKMAARTSTHLRWLVSVSAPIAPLSPTWSPMNFVRLRNAVVPLPAIRQEGAWVVGLGFRRAEARDYGRDRSLA